MKRMRTHVELAYLDILKHKIKVFREDGRAYFKLPEDTEHCRRRTDTIPNKEYSDFIERLIKQ